MLTLTAPSSKRFGATHTRITTKRGKTRPCYCGKWHSENFVGLGTPVDPSTYDYDAAADFNKNATRLFAVTIQKLNRVLGRTKGDFLRVARVVEFQRRGLVHIHALVVGCVSQADLDLVVSGGINPRTGYSIKPAESSGWQWGPRCDASTRPAAIASAYVRKVVSYATKDTSKACTGAKAHARRMSEAGAKCRECDCTALHCSYGRRVFQSNTGGLLYVEQVSDRMCRRRLAGRKNWGFTGHILSKTRNWPMTFSHIREARRQYAISKADSNLIPLTKWSRVRPRRSDE